MVEKIYYWLHRLTSKPQERDEYSAGYWQDKVRQKAINICLDCSGRVLEVGCGEGLFLAELIQSNSDLEVWGIDRWSRILFRAKTRMDSRGIKTARLLEADADNLPFADSSFDVIICINVFFNMDSIEKVKKALGEMSRVCKPGGSVVFDLRNSLNPLLYFKYKCAGYYDLSTKNLPLKTYKLKDIVSILNERRLRIRHKFYIGIPLGIIAPIIVLEAEKLLTTKV